MSGSLGSPLTRMELEVLRLVVIGLANKAIGHELGVTLQTAKAHISSLLRKSGTANRTELTIWAISSGVVELPGPPARPRMVDDELLTLSFLETH